jgi:hypothetical protein
MALIELAEKQADNDLARDMLAYAADRIMEVEVALRTGAARARARRCARSSATATGNGTGTPVRGGSRWRSPSYAWGAICQASSNPGRGRHVQEPGQPPLRRYISLEALARVTDNPNVRLPAVTA